MLQILWRFGHGSVAHLLFWKGLKDIYRVLAQFLLLMITFTRFRRRGAGRLNLVGGRAVLPERKSQGY